MAKSTIGPVVTAFGGNALLPDPDNPAAQEQRASDFARALKLLLAPQSGMALVHGNGPQVGMILLRIEATRDHIPPETLDVLVAETQGSIGYLLSRTIRSKVQDKEIAAILTQVLVDPKDPNFDQPSKPIGPFYSKQEAERLTSKFGWRMADTPGKGWRRVVPSPRPREIIEIHTIADAVNHGHLVIAGGGGGIPIIDTGKLEGVEAVVDKDLTASLLAVKLDASMLVILTDVPHISMGFGTARQEAIPVLDSNQAQTLLEKGEFPAGSMGPKVEACMLYCRATGKRALITDVNHLDDALKGREGTWIVA